MFVIVREYAYTFTDTYSGGVYRSFMFNIVLIMLSFA